MAGSTCNQNGSAVKPGTHHGVQRRWAPSRAIALIAFAVSGCNVIPTRGEIENYEISGRVVDRTNGGPLPDAYVCAHYGRIGAHAYGSALIHTRADGSYSIPANPRHVALLDTGDSMVPFIAAGHDSYKPIYTKPKEFKGPLHMDFELERLPATVPSGIQIAPFAGCADVAPPRKAR